MIHLKIDLTTEIELLFDIRVESNTLQLDPWDLIFFSDRALTESIFQ